MVHEDYDHHTAHLNGKERSGQVGQFILVVLSDNFAHLRLADELLNVLESTRVREDVGYG